MNKPTLTLGLNTALGAGSLALFEGGAVLNSFKGNSSVSLRGENVFETIDKLLTELNVNINELNQIVVCTGPGSFTGIRLGLSVAQGLVLGSGCRLAGVSFLESLTCLTTESGKVLTICCGLQEKYFWREYLLDTRNRQPLKLSQGKAESFPNIILKTELAVKENTKILCDEITYKTLIQHIQQKNNFHRFKPKIRHASDNVAEFITGYVLTNTNLEFSQIEPDYF